MKCQKKKKVSGKLEPKHVKAVQPKKKDVRKRRAKAKKGVKLGGEAGGEQVRATQTWIVEDDDNGNDAGDSKDSDGDFSDVELANGLDDGGEGKAAGQWNFSDDEEDGDDVMKGLLDQGDISEEEDDGGKKSFELLEAVRAIIPTKKNPMKRKEASKNVEEFVAVKRRINVGEGGINKFLESVKEAGDTKTAEKVAKLQAETENERSLKKKRIKTLDAPAERITSDKVKRTLLYENAKEEVSKWNSIVYHNRNAEQLVFPLSKDSKAFKNSLKKKDSTEFMPVTPLDEEIAKALYGEDYVQRKKAEMAKDPAKTDMESYLLSVEEAMATHSEMAKLRALQSYAMAKAKRQNKIKSKKYHRLLRKSKIKQQMKEFEELQKKDPEAALVKLEELERSRVQERMSLKHRNTSKWAKMQAARAKYDKDSRVALSEQLKISRDLTQKVQESSDDEDEEDMELPQLVKSSVENPWMLKSSLQENEKLQMYYTGYKKFWEEYNRQIQKQQAEAKADASDDDNDESGSESCSESGKKNDNLKERPKRNTDGDADEFREIRVNDEQINTEDFSENLEETDNMPISQNETVSMQQEESKKSLEVNPDNFLKISKKSSSIAPQFSAQNSQVVDLLEEFDESDEESEQRNLIAEAFEDDDVVNEFHTQKRNTIEESKPQDIDNFLPGWGSWVGKNIVPSEKKRRRFIKKAKPGPPRKDARASHVIINEGASEKLQMHQVKELPFPFTRVKDFERSVRAPIGRTWMPESAVKSLTAPRVITRLGQTIKPISEDVLAKPKEKKFNVPNTIVRLAKVTTAK